MATCLGRGLWLAQAEKIFLNFYVFAHLNYFFCYFELFICSFEQFFCLNWAFELLVIWTIFFGSFELFFCSFELCFCSFELFFLAHLNYIFAHLNSFFFANFWIFFWLFKLYCDDCLTWNIKMLICKFNSSIEYRKWRHYQYLEWTIVQTINIVQIINSSNGSSSNADSPIYGVKLG